MTTARPAADSHGVRREPVRAVGVHVVLVDLAKGRGGAYWVPARPIIGEGVGIEADPTLRPGRARDRGFDFGTGSDSRFGVVAIVGK